MECDALAEMSREQLVELVLALAAEVAELKARLGQPPKTPGNSSVPPSVGFKAIRAGRRARTRRRGHDGISRRRQRPDVLVRCRPTACAGCGEPLPEAGQRRVGRSQVIELRHLFGRAIRLHAIRDTLTPASFTRRRRRIENAVDRLVFRAFLPEPPDTANARRLQARYREHRARLFVFVDRPDVPPTNNASEQDLRPAVIHRKVTGGYRSQAGADGSAIVTSLLTTARKCGENLFQALRSIAGPSPLHADGMPT